MKIVAIVQARTGSTRLPNKVMKTIGGKPLIELLLSRLSRAQLVDKIILATPKGESNKSLVQHVRSLGYGCFCGDEKDVLDRYFKAAVDVQADVVVRITGDCPLVDAGLVDQAIKEFKRVGVDYLSNASPPTYPDGLDIEVFTFAALQRSAEEANDEYDREHVTPYLLKGDDFKRKSLLNDIDLSNLRWTVDEQVDLDVVSAVFSHFAPNIYFTWQQVRELQLSQPELFLSNQEIIRNEGAIMGTGQKL